MTVGSQVKQTLSSIKGAAATLTLYQNTEQNSTSKEMLGGVINELNNIINDLDVRVKKLEFEEPAYKGQ